MVRERGFGHKKGDPWVALASSPVCAGTRSACTPRSKGIKIADGIDDRGPRACIAPHPEPAAPPAARLHAEAGVAVARRLGRERDVEGAGHRGDSNKDPRQ